MAKPKQALRSTPWTIFTVPSDVPEVAFAVLRRDYAGHRNDARVYAHAKLHPISRPSSLAEWRPQVRHEVLLPDDADDRLLDARVLLEDFEAEQVPGQRDLVTHVKLTPAEVGRLHPFWEMGRRFAREEFVVQERLAVLMIMHAPPLGDCPSAPAYPPTNSGSSRFRQVRHRARVRRGVQEGRRGLGGV